MLKMNLNQITLPSINIDDSVRFYTQMGFNQIVATDDYARFEASLGDATFSLHAVKSVARENSVVTYFEVDAVANVVKDLKQLGIKMHFR